MLKQLLDSMKTEPQAVKANRQHARRAGDRCVVLVNGKMHPIENWSSGGLLFVGDDRLFALGQDCDVTLKFKLRDDMINIEHKGAIVRKSDGKIAVRFAPISKKIQASFQQVVDDFVSQRFAESQLM